MTAEPPENARSLQQPQEAAASCHGCDLWESATQTVFGEGEQIEAVATVHPSSILRAADEESREAAMASFIADLKVAARNA
jgi:uracil-DNA glycosylase